MQLGYSPAVAEAAYGWLPLATVSGRPDCAQFVTMCCISKILQPGKCFGLKKWQLLSLGKDKFHPRTGHGVLEGKLRYSSTPSLTSAPVDCGCSTPRLGRFTPGKHVTHCVGSRGGRVRKISPSPPPGFDPRTFHPVPSRYTTTTLSQPYFL